MSEGFPLREENIGTWGTAPPWQGRGGEGIVSSNFGEGEGGLHQYVGGE